MSQEKRVLEFLKNDYPEYHNTKTIHKYIKVPERNIGTYLSRLHRNGKIIRDKSGPLYRYADPDETQKLELIPECYCPIVSHTFYCYADIDEGFIDILLKEGGRSPSPTPTTNYNNDMIIDKSKIDFWSNIPYYWEGKKKIRDVVFRKHHYQIKESALKLEIQEMSNRGKSYNLIEFDIILGYLEGIFYPFFDKFNWLFPNWAFNIDHTELRLEGVKSITYRDVKGTIYRWYQKNNLSCLREEIHGTATLQLDNILQILGKKWKVPLGVADLRDQIRELRMEIQKDRKEKRRLQHTIDRLIDEIHELGGQKPLCIKY